MAECRIPCGQVEKNKDADSNAALAKVLFDTALLESGFDLEHPQEFNSRVLRILADNMGIKGDLMPEVGPACPHLRHGCHGRA